MNGHMLDIWYTNLSYDPVQIAWNRTLNLINYFFTVHIIYQCCERLARCRLLQILCFTQFVSSASTIAANIVYHFAINFSMSLKLQIYITDIRYVDRAYSGFGVQRCIKNILSALIRFAPPPFNLISILPLHLLIC